MAVYNFIGFIYTVGINRCVDVPPEIFDKLGEENFIPVKIRVGGIIKRTNLIPSGSGQFRLFIDSEIRKVSGKDIGEFIEIEIERDNEPRDTNPPADLREALDANKAAYLVFINSTENKQLEILRYIKSAKSLSTRMKRIDYVVSVLLQEAKKRRGK